MRLLPAGLLGRIFLALLAVGLLPWSVASYRLMSLNREAMTEQVLRTHAVAASTTASRAEAFVEARRLAARSAAGASALIEDARGSAGTEVLAELLRAPLGVAAAVVLNGEGGEVVRVQRKDPPPALAPLLEEPPAEVLRSLSGELTTWARLDVPLAEGAGWLAVAFDLAPLAAHLQPKELGELAELILVEGEGRLVLGSSAAWKGLPAQLRRAALSGKVSGAGRFEDRSGAAVLGAFAPVPTVPWTVISRQPARVAEATARQLRQRSWLAVVLTMLLTLAVAFGAQRKILRPLRELIEGQRRLAGGEAGASAGGPAGAGEIEELKASFRLLERRILEKEELGKVFLSRYQVLDVVGEGAMGTVFRGWDPALERPVALKTVRFSAEDGVPAGEGSAVPGRSELGSRLLREAVAVARFSHPNIVGIYDVQQSPEVAFLSMEYVDGESLEAYLGRRGRLPVLEAVPLGLAVARGLAAAHQQGTVHRDVKPANVLLGREGEIKIADFGISQRIKPESAGGEPVFGTPGFIPPETLQGKGYGPPGDFFALGVLLYQLLTGSLPYSGSSLPEVVRRTLAGGPRPPRELEPSIPPPLERLVLDLLAADPFARPAAAEVVERLTRLAADFGARWSPRLRPRPAAPASGPTRVFAQEPSAPVGKGATREVSREPPEPPPPAREV